MALKLYPDEIESLDTQGHAYLGLEQVDKALSIF